MATNNITSVNSVFKLVVPDLGINTTLQGYAAGAAFLTESVELTENQIGVDGLKSAGYTPKLTMQTISLQADSPSVEIFDIIAAEMKATRDIILIDGLIELPSVKKSYALALGTLVGYTSIPEAQTVLQRLEYTINWGLVTPLPT